MLIESPRCASSRISEQSEMVRDVPLPPDEDSSRFTRTVTAGWRQPGATKSLYENNDILPIVSTMPVNIVGRLMNSFGILRKIS